MSPVLKRFGHVLLIVAILGATGTHWFVLQSVAWATMLAGNAQSGSLQVAIAKTFDGKHPCTLCKTITQGKRSEKKSELQTNFRKPELLNQKIAIVLNPPSQFQWLEKNNATAPSFGQTPPVPPPRILRG